MIVSESLQIFSSFYSPLNLTSEQPPDGGVFLVVWLVPASYAMGRGLGYTQIINTLLPDTQHSVSL